MTEAKIDTILCEIRALADHARIQAFDWQTRVRDGRTKALRKRHTQTKANKQHLANKSNHTRSLTHGGTSAVRRGRS